MDCRLVLETIRIQYVIVVLVARRIGMLSHFLLSSVVATKSTIVRNHEETREEGS